MDNKPATGIHQEDESLVLRNKSDHELIARTITNDGDHQTDVGEREEETDRVTSRGSNDIR